MSAAVLPFPQRRDPSRWQIDEIAECYRVIDILGSVGMSVALEADVSDEGDPWLVFVREDSQDVIIHITRIAGQVIAASAASDKLFRGRSMRDVLHRILQAQPFVLPASRPLGADDRLLMHPATMLVAVVATAFLASQDSATLAGDGKVALTTSDVRAEGELLGVARNKQPLSVDTGIPGRPAPVTDTHAPYMTTVASAVLVAVAVISGEQTLRSAGFSREEIRTSSFLEIPNEAKHATAKNLGTGLIGTDADLTPFDQWAGQRVLVSEEANQASLEVSGERGSNGFSFVFSEPQIADKAFKGFSGQAVLQASSVRLNVHDTANSLTFAVQLAPSTLKPGFGLDGSATEPEFINGAYSSSTPFAARFVSRIAALADPVAASSLQPKNVSEGNFNQHRSGQEVTLSPLSNPVALNSSQPAASLTGFSIAGSPASPAQTASDDGGVAANTSFVNDFSASPTGPNLALATMKISVSELFWQSATTMRSMGIDIYDTSRNGSTRAEVAFVNSASDNINPKIILDKNSIFSDQMHLSSDLLAKTVPNSPATSTTVPELTGATFLESLDTTSKQPLEATIVGKSIPDIAQPTSYSVVSTMGGASVIMPSIGEQPSIGSGLAPIRSAADIVKAVQSIVSFAFDPRHEIALKGQDLEILQILVRANPLIAGADRVLLSYGQILAGDGVMVMPGVALLPAEVFVPKLVSGLSMVQEGALRISFRDDLIVTLVGVIDI